ncbi:metallophosphoesterase family protein [Rhodoplanes sp. Z2-YC6860]|uniref:metallophosphoesterase family protein n=1 Tax=Rhodoplanes sp. Z2-YC6860 TaxID=674703 RepID=UPI00078BD585|nr:metallophosphoesterase family protein [Rhodoplanes sp. Z2-YC6860]AMN44302.1 metallophosphoesterase [Rhodoplanes sp. Z2-YC6860]
MASSSLTFAIGDVHGCFAKLDNLMHRCAEYAGSRPHRFVLLGDYIDRGTDSRQVIKKLRRLTGQRPDEVICLKGNHEDMLLSAVDEPCDSLWINNGGDTTLASYGVERPAELPADDIAWIRGLPLCHDDGLRFFVHAGIDPAVPLDRQDGNTMLWTRKRYSDEFNPGRLIVHGHTPLRSQRPDLGPHRINLDTGAVYGGPLSAAAFTDQDAAPEALLVGSEVFQVGCGPNVKHLQRFVITDEY